MGKKVLIIAYCFPPMPVIGSQRPYGLAKYLQRFDWEPIVLTVKHPGNFPPGIKVIATDYTDIIAVLKKMIGVDPYTGIHQQLGIEITKNYNHPTWKGKLLKFAREAVAYPDSERGWYKHAVKAASELMERERINAVISTSFPATSHLIAKKIKQKYGIPWVADLRDLWTQNSYSGKFKIISLMERRLELKTLSHADALVTVSEPLADMLKSLHLNKEVQCITNGYDPDAFNTKPLNLSKKFTITYTGTLYNGARDPSTLFEATAKLMNQNKIDRTHMEIRFYGDIQGWLIDDIKKFGLEHIVRLYGTVPREEALKLQKESQILLLLLVNDARDQGYYTGKLFEYLGAKRPILAIGGANSIVKDLLANTNAGKFAENKEQAEAILMQHYQEFITSGEVKYGANGDIENYTYNSMAVKYSKLLNKLAVS